MHDVPTLNTLLAVARLQVHQVPLDIHFAGTAGLADDRQSNGRGREADLPLAAIACSADGVDDRLQQQYPWIVGVEPVHLLLQRDSFMLDWPIKPHISQDDTQILMADLNQHFHQDDMLFVTGHSGQWYLLLEYAPDIRSYLPEEVAGRLVDGFHLQGPGASKWQRILNEIQMLLFSHPVNQRREQQGHAAVNSLWLFGSGQLPKADRVNAVTLVGDSPLAKGLAMLHGAKCHPLSINMATLGHHDALVYADSRPEIDRWLTMAHQALKARKLESLSLMLGHAGLTYHFELKPFDVWKFWRKSRPWSTYLA